MRIIIYTNILTPYRKYFFDMFYKECYKQNIDFSVLVMAETESDRFWKYKDLCTCYTELLAYRTIKVKNVNIHINRNIKKRIEYIRPSIIIAAGSYLCPGIWTLARIKQKNNFALLFWSESHDNEIKKYNKILLFIRERLRCSIYEKFDGFWSPGKFSKKFIQKYAHKEFAYFQVPNLIEEDKYRKVAKKDEVHRRDFILSNRIKNDQKILLCPIRLVPAKGILEFLQIFKICKTKDCFTVIIAGDGELYSSILQKSDEYNLNIRLLGFKTQEEMIQLYSLSDGLLLPSISDPNPLSCIEALWCGLPLIVSEHVGNYPEVVKEGENGIIFTYSNLGESADKIDALMRMPIEWWQRASEISLELAHKSFSSSVIISNLVQSLAVEYGQ